MRLLLIEDDTMIGRAVRQGLGDAGFTVDWVMDGLAAERALANDVYDLALLDLGLPGQDGMAVLRGLRTRGNAIPVLIITAGTRSPTASPGSTPAPTTTCSNRSTWTNSSPVCVPCCAAMPAAAHPCCNAVI